MAVTKTKTLTAGNWEMSIGTTLIDAELLGEITITYTEGTTETETQAGTFTMPNGRVEEATAEATIFLPNMDYLQVIFPDAYNAPTGTGTTGNVVLGGSNCSTPQTYEINFHQVCADSDNDDIHIFAAYIIKNVEATLSTDGAFELPVTFNAQKTANGVMRFGTGDLTQKSEWDVASGTTVPVDES